MKLLLCGGGTAGHINPAIAIAEELKSRDKNARFLFIGRRGGKENELIEKAGLEYKTIKIEGLSRSLSTDNIRRIIRALQARTEAEKIINDFSPDIVVGTGGYVCWPVITAAKRLGIRTAIHESNITPGVTTKLVAGKCDVIFLNHEKTSKYLGGNKKVITVGNPLRSDFDKITKAEARRKLGIGNKELFILSFGGSIGAQRLNEVIFDVINNYSSKTEGVRHLHATGKRYYKDGEKSFYEKGYRGCKIVPYISDMPLALRAADIVICRCGAMTLSEIGAVGVASILIPSPNVTGNHQYKNALHLASGGAADIIEEKDLSEKLLTDKIIALKSDENERKNRAKKILTTFKPDAAKRIIDELFILKNRRKGTAN